MIYLRFSVFPIVLLLTACVTTELQKMQEQGAVTLSQEAIAARFTGNSLQGTDGSWTVYYREDGAKLAQVQGKRTERKWWVDDKGNWCETRVRDGRELCALNFIEQDGVYHAFNPDGSLNVKATLAQGNPANL